jgi:hypothetical protein
MTFIDLISPLLIRLRIKYGSENAVLDEAELETKTQSSKPSRREVDSCRLTGNIVGRKAKPVDLDQDVFRREITEMDVCSGQVDDEIIDSGSKYSVESEQLHSMLLLPFIPWTR